MEHFTLQLPGLPVTLPSYSSWLLPGRRMSLKNQTRVGGTQNAPGGSAGPRTARASSSPQEMGISTGRDSKKGVPEKMRDIDLGSFKNREIPEYLNICWPSSQPSGRAQSPSPDFTPLLPFALPLAPLPAQSPPVLGASSQLPFVRSMRKQFRTAAAC